MKALKTLLLVAGVAVATLSQAQSNQASPAEQAGICAANAVLINGYADQVGNTKLASLARAQVTRNYNTYGRQPGFIEASKWEAKQNLTIDQRIKIADGCANSGF